MINRIDKHLVITTNNLKALEAVSEWIYAMLKTTYCINIELFQNMTLYHIYVPINSSFDKKCTRMLNDYLESKNTKLMEGS